MNVLLNVVLAAVMFFHTELKTSSPSKGAVLEKAPAVVTLTFTERVTVGLSSISILKSDSSEVAKLVVTATKDPATIEAKIPQVLAAGKYIVRWRTAAADGHVARSAYAFTVNPPK